MPWIGRFTNLFRRGRLDRELEGTGVAHRGGDRAGAIAGRSAPRFWGHAAPSRDQP